MSSGKRRGNGKSKIQRLPPLREIRNSVSQVEFIFNSAINYSMSANSFLKNLEPATPYNSVSEISIKQEPGGERINSTSPPTVLLKHSRSYETDTEELQIERNYSVIYCPKVPSGLEKKNIMKTAQVTEIENKYPKVSMGGYYKPQNCNVRFKVAVILPCRNHEDHLRIFINHIHIFLSQQKLEYRVFVLEQIDPKAFNIGKLLNVGFIEAKNYIASGNWDCIMMHDIDATSEDSQYPCNRQHQPRHLAIYQDRCAGYKIIWPEYFGDAVVFTPNQFIKVNGFSNSYWGWHSEDEELEMRSERRYKIFRCTNSGTIRYSSLSKNSEENPIKLKLISTTLRNQDKDGLSSLKYKLIQKVEYHLYTKITVDLTE